MTALPIETQLSRFETELLVFMDDAGQLGSKEAASERFCSVVCRNLPGCFSALASGESGLDGELAIKVLDVPYPTTMPGRSDQRSRLVRCELFLYECAVAYLEHYARDPGASLKEPSRRVLRAPGLDSLIPDFVSVGEVWVGLMDLIKARHSDSDPCLSCRRCQRAGDEKPRVPFLPRRPDARRLCFSCIQIAREEGL